MNIRKIWIVGADGRVGTAINELINRRVDEVLNTDMDEVDITDVESVIAYGNLNRPDIIINCAGLSSAEACEKEIERAYRINAIGARNLSIIARKIGAKLIHISTDHVFDGANRTPYTEFDRPNPQSVYGKSKLAGEQFVKDFARKYMIIRSSWIYGEGDNFVQDVLNLAKNREVIRIAKDQFGSPTSAKELAKLVLYLMETSEYGTYHGVCEGSCSRAEFAREILRLVGKDVEVEEVVKEEAELYSTKPSDTVLDNFMLNISSSYKLLHWKEALAEYIKTIR